jgi:hypothetical protein
MDDKTLAAVATSLALVQISQCITALTGASDLDYGDFQQLISEGVQTVICA